MTGKKKNLWLRVVLWFIMPGEIKQWNKRKMDKITSTVNKQANNVLTTEITVNTARR